MATAPPMGQPILAFMFWGMIVCVILELEIFLALRKSMIPGLVLPILYFLAAVAAIVIDTIHGASANRLLEHLFYTAFPAFSLLVSYTVCRAVRLLRRRPKEAGLERRAGK